MVVGVPEGGREVSRESDGDAAVPGPRGPAGTLAEDGDEAGDGVPVGAAADLPRVCHQGGSRVPETSPVLTGGLIVPLSPSPPQVYNHVYFQVTVDDLSADAKPRRMVCHANTPGILPVQWCLKNGVSLERPRGYEGQDFDWAEYLKRSGTEAAPEGCFPDVSPQKRQAEAEGGARDVSREQASGVKVHC